MKLFSRLLLGPAALGLMAPVAAALPTPGRAADLNLDGVRSYASEEQVTSIDQFSDVLPTDWAYQALSNLIERYGCVAGYPDGTYRGQRAMTRYEAAALLNACLDRISEVTDELKRLMKEFEKELAVLRGRVDGLEAKVGELEATQFSTTTKLSGLATFVIGANSYGGSARSGGFASLEEFVDSDGYEVVVDALSELRDDVIEDVFDAVDIDDLIDDGRIGDATLGDLEEAFGEELNDALREIKRDGGESGQQVINALLIDAFTEGRVRPGEKLSSRTKRLQGGTAFNYDLQLTLDTSFTGKDLLRTNLRAGNFGDGPWGGPVVGLNDLETNFEADSGPDNVKVDRLFYQFPLGSGFTATVGPVVEKPDMLAMVPSVYSDDPILDLFTYAGAPGVYNRELGSGAGLWWTGGNFNVSVLYIATNGNNGSPNRFEDNCGGIGTDCSASTFTTQLGYAAENWGLALAYNYSRPQGGEAGIYGGNATPLAVLGSQLSDNINSFAVSGYWQPSDSGWIPSISTGWGLNNHSSDTYDFIDGATTQSWYVGLQWDDVLLKGNSLGMAVGQATFLTSSGDDDILGADDGNYVWEWWYKWQVTDNISVTPALFYLSVPYGQLQKAPSSSDASFDNFGGLVKTTFRF